MLLSLEISLALVPSILPCTTNNPSFAVQRASLLVTSTKHSGCACTVCDSRSNSFILSTTDKFPHEIWDTLFQQIFFSDNGLSSSTFQHHTARLGRLMFGL